MNGKGNQIGPRKKRILIVGIAVITVAALVVATYLFVGSLGGSPAGVGVAAPTLQGLNNSTKVVSGRTTFYDTFIIESGFRNPDRSANASQWSWTFFRVYDNNGTTIPILPSPALCTSTPPGMADCAAPTTGWYLVISDRNWSWNASYPETNNGTTWYGGAAIALYPGNLLTIVSPNQLAGASYKLIWILNNIAGGVMLDNPYSLSST